MTSDEQHRPKAPGPDAAQNAPGDDGTTDERTFEELMADLESITERMAAGDLGIEAAADLFERAETLHALATERLLQVRARVEGMAVPPSPPG